MNNLILLPRFRIRYADAAHAGFNRLGPDSEPVSVGAVTPTHSHGLSIHPSSRIICDIDLRMDPSHRTAEEMWAKPVFLDPAIRLLNQIGRAQFFYSRNSLLLPTWLVGRVYAVGDEGNIEIFCFNIGSPQRGFIRKERVPFCGWCC